MFTGNNTTSDNYDKLKENITIVMKNYFAASERLIFHNSVSQWTLSILSLGLIVIPLLTVTKMPLRYSQNVIDFASISLAVAVLMLSLLIGANNYSARGEKMYQAGLEFNKLIWEVRCFEFDGNRMDKYNDFSYRYVEILRRYENVGNIDNLKGQININRKTTVSINSLMQQLEYWWLFCREMIAYFVAIILEFGFIGLLVTK
jgi:SMODS and SLOG-associating 2TM effector domain family 5